MREAIETMDLSGNSSTVEIPALRAWLEGAGIPEGLGGVHGWKGLEFQKVWVTKQTFYKSGRVEFSHTVDFSISLSLSLSLSLPMAELRG